MRTSDTVPQTTGNRSTDWTVIAVDLSNISQDLTVYHMGMDKKTYLSLNPVMNSIQIVTLLMLNGLATAWIIPQLCQNVWVTLAQTLQQENICLSTAAAKNPMSTCLVGIPSQAGEFPADLETHRSNEIPESHTPQPHKDHHQQAVVIVNPLEE
ncbi:hypothetical protein HGM15179_018267 [Zosterops borbonicus]|uniref:Uncharacterized protein n=1 Tax=Zosterops borbonicus TaxID=364589 RepID=A0A8K1FZC4_9PASS|nr:hypothetical protein HGM15179_018267 [Zosterops borbonicus]